MVFQFDQVLEWGNNVVVTVWYVYSIRYSVLFTGTFESESSKFLVLHDLIHRQFKFWKDVFLNLLERTEFRTIRLMSGNCPDIRDTQNHSKWVFRSERLGFRRFYLKLLRISGSNKMRKVPPIVSSTTVLCGPRTVVLRYGTIWQYNNRLRSPFLSIFDSWNGLKSLLRSQKR